MKTIIIGGFSGIAEEIIKSLEKRKNEIVYTFNNTYSKKFKKFKGYKLDISSTKSIDDFSKKKDVKNWDNLIVMPATLKPIGLFDEVKAADWSASVDLNFSNQMYLINKLYRKRRVSNKNKTIILWAGGGTNKATKYYSAYTISKIAQIKMAELLDYEMINTKVVILGPGWVKTKMHQETLKNKKYSRENFFRTENRFKENNFVKTKEIVNCVNSIINSNKKETGGRNISIEFDKWKNEDFFKILSIDENMYKLRRDFNDFNLEDLDFNIQNLIIFLSNNSNMYVFKSIFFNFFQRLINLKTSLELKNNRSLRLFDYNIKFPKNDITENVIKKNLSLYDFLIFHFYNLNKNKFKSILELGVNSGLHSYFLIKNKIKIKSLEIELDKYNYSKKFLNLNKINHKIIKKEKNKLENDIENFDLVKIESKLYESYFLNNINKFNLNKNNILMKISSLETQKKFWQIFKDKKYRIKSQKIGWKNITKISDVPSNYDEGYLFI